MAKLAHVLMGVFIVAGLLPGCSPVGVEETVQPAPEIATTSTVQPTGTTPASTPTPALEPTPTFPPDMDCGEVFCQQPWRGLFSRPFTAEFNQTIDPTYPYASTRNDTLDPHHGVEFPNGAGTPVLAAREGEVIFAGTDALTVLGPYTSFYGNVVILKHAGLYQGRDVYTLYAHLSEILVDEGQEVGLGEVIGKVGATGAADGSHLHFEVRLDENTYASTTNPMLWFAPIWETDHTEGSALAGIIRDPYGQPLDRFTLSVERLDASGAVEDTYYPVTYYPAGVNGNPALLENFVLPDLPPGDYRLTLIYGTFYEIDFTLEPGVLGFIHLTLD